MIRGVCDSIIKWELFNNEDIINKFPLDEWNLIVTDIYSQKEWQEFIYEYSNLVCCFIMRTCYDNKEIAFAYLYNEDGKFKTVSFHGGGWNKSIYHTLLYYRGAVILIKALLNFCIKVRTSCLISNKTAYRFLKSIGFVNYLNSKNYHYFWINNNRLEKSRIYKYINKKYSTNI